MSKRVHNFLPRIALRLLAGVLLVGSLALVVIGYWNLETQRQAIEARWVRESVHVAHGLAPGIGFSAQPPFAMEQTAPATSEPRAPDIELDPASMVDAFPIAIRELIRADLLVPQGDNFKVQISTDERSVGSVVRARDLQLQPESEGSLSPRSGGAPGYRPNTVSFRVGPNLHVLVPLYNRDGDYVMVRLLLDGAETDRLVGAARWTVLAAGSVPIIAVLFILGLLSWRWVDRPMDELGAVIERLRTGDEHARVRIERMGISTHLGQAFNSLVEQQLRSTSQAMHLAQHDTLTGLANRRLLLERLQSALEKARRHQRLGALLFVDLDGFKSINDEHGHAVGDEMLIRTAQRLRGAVRKVDTVARLGGDEFAVLVEELTGLEDDEALSAQRAADAIRQKLLDCVATPERIDGQELRVHASIGLCVFDAGDDHSAHSVLVKADEAMYQDKRGIQSKPGVQPPAYARRTFGASDLRRAIEAEVFHVNYQPQVDHSGKIVAVEAHLVWPRKHWRHLFASEIDEQVDRYGLNELLTEHLLSRALKDFNQWRSIGLTDDLQRLIMCVDFGAYEANNFCANVLELLETFDMPAQRLELALPSSTSLTQLQLARVQFERLAQDGVRFTLDEAGSGQSVLCRLRDFSFDGIRLAPWIAQRLPTSKYAFVALDSLVHLSSNLNLELTAMGVETWAQRDALMRRGIRTLQGNYIAAPLCAQQLREQLEARRFVYARSLAGPAG